MITYNWTIAQLERRTDTGGVVIAHWNCTGVDGDYSARVYGTAGFTPDPDDPNFKPFDQLTEADVLSWVWTEVDKDETEANIASKIDAQKNPETLSGTPW